MTCITIKSSAQKSQDKKRLQNARLTTSFHDNLGKLVPECQIILNFTIARDDGRVGGDIQTYEAHKQLRLAPVKSASSAYYHADVLQVGCPSSCPNVSKC